MLRRSLLTAAIAIPAIVTTRKASAQCWPVLQRDPGGSSVSPFGRASSTARAGDRVGKRAGDPIVQGDPCGSGGGPFSPSDWPAYTIARQLEYQLQVGTGYLPDPGVLAISGPHDPYLVQVSGRNQISDEVQTVAGYLGIGGVGGGFAFTAIAGVSYAIRGAGIGAMTAGVVGAFVGAGIGLVAYFVIEHTTIIYAEDAGGALSIACPTIIDGNVHMINSFPSLSPYGPPVGGFRMYGHTAASQAGGGARWFVCPNKAN